MHLTPPCNLYLAQCSISPLAWFLLPHSAPIPTCFKKKKALCLNGCWIFAEPSLSHFLFSQYFEYLSIYEYFTFTLLSFSEISWRNRLTRRSQQRIPIATVWSNYRVSSWMVLGATWKFSFVQMSNKSEKVIGVESIIFMIFFVETRVLYVMLPLPPTHPLADCPAMSFVFTCWHLLTFHK